MFDPVPGENQGVKPGVRIYKVRDSLNPRSDLTGKQERRTSGETGVGSSKRGGGRVATSALLVSGEAGAARSTSHLRTGSDRMPPLYVERGRHCSYGERKHQRPHPTRRYAYHGRAKRRLPSDRPDLSHGAPSGGTGDRPVLLGPHAGGAGAAEHGAHLSEAPPLLSRVAHDAAN